MTESDSSIPEAQSLSAQEKCLALFMGLYIFLLPLKFGVTIGVNDFYEMPQYIWNWIVQPWPVQLGAVLSCLLLLLTVLIYPRRLREERSFLKAGIPFVGLVMLPFLTKGDAHGDFLIQFSALSIMALATYLSAAISLARHPRLRTFYLLMLLLSLAYVAFDGLHQYFWGFDQTRAFLEQKQAEGVQIHALLTSRTNQNLVFSSFSYSNSFAAHLLLLLPLLAASYLMLKRSSLTHKKLLQGILITISVLGLCVFVLARSRAGFAVALLIPALVWAFWRGRRQGLIAFSITCVLGCCAYYFVREVPSLVIREEYWRICFEMFKAEPLGQGAGTFSDFYLAQRTPGFEDVKLPHNLSGGLLAQFGVWSIPVLIMFILFVFIQPLMRILSFEEKRSRLLPLCYLAGLAAWWLHAEFDHNIYIPGTFATVALVIALLQLESAVDPMQEFDKPERHMAFMPVVQNFVHILICCCGIVFFVHLLKNDQLQRLHQRYFGNEMSELQQGAAELNNQCLYCLKPLDLSDEYGNCLHCGAGVNSDIHSPQAIFNEALRMEKLLGENVELWQMCAQKLITMPQLFQRNKWQIHPILNEAYLLHGEQAYLRAIAIQQSSTLYRQLAELRVQLKKSPELILVDYYHALKLNPGSYRAIRSQRQYVEYLRPRWYDRKLTFSYLVLNELYQLHYRLGKLLFEMRAGNNIQKKLADWEKKWQGLQFALKTNSKNIQIQTKLQQKLKQVIQLRQQLRLSQGLEVNQKPSR